jgi:hypothetical protein
LKHLGSGGQGYAVQCRKVNTNYWFYKGVEDDEPLYVMKVAETAKPKKNLDSDARKEVN